MSCPGQTISRIYPGPVEHVWDIEECYIQKAPSTTESPAADCSHPGGVGKDTPVLNEYVLGPPALNSLCGDKWWNHKILNLLSYVLRVTIFKCRAFGLLKECSHYSWIHVFLSGHSYANF